MHFPFDPRDHAKSLHRRSFLGRRPTGWVDWRSGQLLGLGANRPAQADEGKWRGVVEPPHFPVKARRIIHLCMAGGPSQFESLRLEARARSGSTARRFPKSFTKGQQLAQLQGISAQGARDRSSRFPSTVPRGRRSRSHSRNIAGIADDICIVRSMQTEQINHDPAHAFMNSGSIIKGRPSMGSWLLYGLGSESDDLPGFIVLTSAGHATAPQPVSARQWSAGLLPSKFQGILFQSKGDAVHYIGNPDGVCQSTQRQVIEEVNRLNGMLAAETLDPEIQTRISQYELAFRMQSSVPELTDFTNEPKAMLDLYGVKQPRRRQLRLELPDGPSAGRAWRPVHPALSSGLGPSHQHREGHAQRRGSTWTARAPPWFSDLKQRGLLDDTLVIWGGEFGRTPMGQGTGRDHHILSFSLWMAGGGIKGGMTHGGTDELGYRAVQDVVHVRDLHATMLHLCGIDHRRLSFKYQGLDLRLTGVEPARVIKQIIA